MRWCSSKTSHAVWTVCLEGRGFWACRGTWKKVSKGCYEVRGKTLGIVGYGHIGSQVGVLAEMLGMKVKFFDIASKVSTRLESASEVTSPNIASDMSTTRPPVPIALPQLAPKGLGLGLTPQVS